MAAFAVAVVDSKDTLVASESLAVVAAAEQSLLPPFEYRQQFANLNKKQNLEHLNCKK